MSSTLFVTGATTLSSTLGVAGATTLSSTLGVSGAVVMSSSLTVSNNLNVDSGTLFVDTSSNKVGVNTPSPTSSLTVNGSANITNDLDARGIFFVKNTGVGIYNSSPAFDLDVIGDVAISGTLSATSGNLTTVSVSSLTVSTSLNVDSGVLFVDTSSNKVGVNTTSPTSSLTVNGSADITGGLLAGQNLYSPTDFALSVQPDPYFSSVGYVGINKLTPTVPLDVIGDVAISGILTVDTSTLVVDPTNNKVGIRNASPGFELDVTGAVQATSYQIEASAAKITKLYRDSVSLVSTNDLTSLTAAVTFQTYNHYVAYVSAGDFAQVTYSSSDNDFEDKVIISAYCTSNYVNIVFFNMSATDFGVTTTANITINILVTRAAAS